MPDLHHLPTTPAAPAGRALQSSPRAAQPGERDRFLDVVKSVAIARVLMWHTWGWWWLSWIPAMPAMFFANGVLLEHSLDRRGWWATLKVRMRRLLLPFWAYAAVCVAVMVGEGWRPAPTELVGWVLPVVDPEGPDTAAALWIPLWYVRAYVLFVIGAGVLRFAASRLDWVAVWVAVAGACALGLVQMGRSVPLEVGDAFAYAPFVLAGMVYARRGAPNRGALVGIAAAAGAAAVWWWTGLGPDDGVVNRSWGLTALVGVAGLSAALAARERLGGVRGRLGAAVDLVNRRALTIYLWQGLGLLAADRVVRPRVGQPVPAALLSFAVVIVVVAAAVVVVGPLEDVAARRTRGADPGRAPSSRRTPPQVVRRVLAVGCGAAVAVAALVWPAPVGADDAALPLSGRAVVARAGMVADDLDDSRASAADAPRGSSPEEVLDAWLAENVAMRDEVGMRSLTGAVAAPDGTVRSFAWSEGSPPQWGTDAASSFRLNWWSMTKTATALWLVRSAEAGVVRLDDPVATWLPEFPHAERITLEDLGRHQSGIPAGIGELFLFATPAGDIARFVEDPRLEFEPGEGFAYSRVGYHVLAWALERATGTPWRDAMEELAAEAGVTLGFDEDGDPRPESTDPDGHGYRGPLWAAGGINAPVSDSVRFFRWALTEGAGGGWLGEMTDFSADPEEWFYGLGLVPVCPCTESDGRLRADRVGLDSATGSYAVDPAAAAAVVLAPDSWFDEQDTPRPEVYDLQVRLLDALASRGTA